MSGCVFTEGGFDFSSGFLHPGSSRQNAKAITIQCRKDLYLKNMMLIVLFYVLKEKASMLFS
ncbi:MAG: hypothetical protein BGP13_24980 [Sphingobacteriales bacterium 40-81]|nr:MAG: hypothetical protein BGP13_24980 [Sphingobacteriales bacterium 40-81]